MARRDDDDETRVLEAIGADDHVRRELSWLRAMEKEDALTARDLQRVDPGLVARLAEAGCDVADREDEATQSRRERFARLLGRTLRVSRPTRHWVSAQLEVSEGSSQLWLDVLAG